MASTNTSSIEQYNTIFNNSVYSFWFYFVTICSIPSVVCFIFDFYQFIKHRKTLIYENITHHIILCLLINDFIQVFIIQPFTLVYFYFGHIKYFYSVTYCMFWIYFNYTFINQSLIFTAYASVERYLLLFHKQLMLRHKILFHYIPLLITIVYLPCMLFYLIFLFPCTHNFDPTQYECGAPCFAQSQPIGIINQIIHLFIPVTVLVFFNSFILIRVLAQKKRSAAAVAGSLSANFWKQNSRMIIQLATICLLALAVWIPYVTSLLIQIFGDRAFGGSIIFFHIINATYIPNIGTPFFALIGFPVEIRGRMRTCITYLKRRQQRQNRIANTTTAT
ncbi:unnamed protein product [Adineta steineri]|uniref:G-protein coupled receptors family 1 profile domain-containing protein n=1 Tax=Adineta steineri TaxID=433720 RepID=A0A814HAR9_9BILA|nr:unnamed protein product [Adineta steineri]CAF1177819.1 unnamed protein product [Adineta steineri]CAF1239677.1 unnamed protein product [Adineta steineri]CAF1240595.1 unnamed protein product [Adineta steineri]CAF3857071.1 unnamed protein product [Adineta steineri]